MSSCVYFTGMLSHQLKQHVIDGEKTIIQNPTDQQRYNFWGSDKGMSSLCGPLEWTNNC